MNKLSFTIPGGQQIEAPDGVSDKLNGGFDTSGAALIQLGLSWLFLISALLALIFLIFSGIQWITSQGDPNKIAAAKSRLLYSIIGLIVVAISFFVVRAVLTILGADTSYFFNFSSLGS